MTQYVVTNITKVKGENESVHNNTVAKWMNKTITEGYIYPDGNSTKVIKEVTDDEYPSSLILLEKNNVTFRVSNKDYFMNQDPAYVCEWLFQTRPIISGGLHPSKQRMLIKGRMAVVYVGPRGGKYVKIKGKMVSIKRLA